MKTNNTPNVSDLARNYNSVWIDKGATVFNISLANGETVEIDSDNYSTAEEIANAIISTLNTNTPSTMKTKSAKDLERQMVRISGARFDKALEIYSRYLHNMAVHFSGDKYPHAPAMTPEQLKIKVPQSIYAAI